ncbi:MAG TPA: hypothetical protein VKI65_05950 [Gemmataceae bacterium]|nr:hypothetical protein [Gemmataceae bacterium]
MPERFAIAFGFVLKHHPIRRIGQDKTNQDEKMNQDESRRIKMNRALQDESNESRRIWLAACAR